MKSLLLFLFLGSLSLQAAVLCRYSISNLVREDQDWIQVVIPTEKGFEFQQVQNPMEVHRLLTSVSEQQRIKIENSLNEVTKHYENIISQLKNIAISNRTQLQFRLKDPNSIRDKIIDRAKSYQERGKIFRLEDLHDLAGGRLIVELGSDLYNMTTDKSIWSRLLNIPKAQILEIEIKGQLVEQKKGRYYRAVHLILKHESGVRFELQILSKAVKHWHKWDHSHVYKNKAANSSELEKLKKYSLIWIQTIRLLEDLAFSPDSQAARAELNRLHQDSGVDFSWENWPIILDAHLSSLYDISYQNRFLIESEFGKSMSFPTVNRKAIRDLGHLKL